MPVLFARTIRVVALAGATGLAWLAIELPPAHGQVIGGSSDRAVRVTNSSTADGVQAKIEAIVAELEEQLAILTSLLAEYDDLQDQKPTRPGEDASDEEKQAWQEAYAKWLEKVKAVQQKIERTQERIRELEDELERLQDQTGSARARDREEARRLVASTRYVERLRGEVTTLLSELDRSHRTVRSSARLPARSTARRTAVRRTVRPVKTTPYRDVRSALRRLERTLAEPPK